MLNQTLNGNVVYFILESFGGIETKPIQEKL